MKAKGWAIKSDMEITIDGATVVLSGICTCSWRKKHCETSKRCQMLFGRGGEYDVINKLKRMMGKKFPKSWIDSMGFTSACGYQARQKKIEEFEREYFKKCRPVQVEISRRDK